MITRRGVHTLAGVASIVVIFLLMCLYMLMWDAYTATYAKVQFSTEEHRTEALDCYQRPPTAPRRKADCERHTRLGRRWIWWVAAGEMFWDRWICETLLCTEYAAHARPLVGKMIPLMAIGALVLVFRFVWQYISYGMYPAQRAHPDPPPPPAAQPAVAPTFIVLEGVGVRERIGSGKYQA